MTEIHSRVNSVQILIFDDPFPVLNLSVIKVFYDCRCPPSTYISDSDHRLLYSVMLIVIFHFPATGGNSARRNCILSYSYPSRNPGDSFPSFLEVLNLIINFFLTMFSQKKCFLQLKLQVADWQLDVINGGCGGSGEVVWSNDKVYGATGWR